MGLASTLARRSLLGRPGRTLFSVLGIALGVATVVGVVVLDYNTLANLSLPSGTSGRPDIQIDMPNTRSDNLDLYQVEGISVSAKAFEEFALARIEAPSEVIPDSPENRMRVFMLAADMEFAPQLDLYQLATGANPHSGTREALIGPGIAEEWNLGVGDTIWLSRPKRQSKFECVEGELVPTNKREDVPELYDFHISGVLTRESLGRRSRGMVVVTDYIPGKDVFAGVRVQSKVLGKIDKKVNPETLEENLASVDRYEINEAVILGQAADERAFRMGARMTGLLALVLGLYVIFHTLSMSLSERMKEVGTLHALGSTRSQVGRVFLLEAVVLAGLGALVGVAGGLAIAYGLLENGISTLGTGKYFARFFVPWGDVSALAGIGFLVALIGSVFPLVSLKQTNTVSVLRGEHAPAKRRSALAFNAMYGLLLAIVLPALYFVIVPVVGEMTPELASVLIGALGFLGLVILLSLIMPAVLAGVCAATARPFTALWPLAGRLTAKAMRSAPARIGVCTAALALVTAGFVGLKGMTASLEGEVVAWADEAAKDKVWVGNLPGTNFEELAAHLSEYPGYVGMEKSRTGSIGSFLVQGLAPRHIAGYGPAKDNRELVAALDKRQGMIVSRRLAAVRNYEVGDDVVLSAADGRKVPFQIVAITDAYGHHPHPHERIYGLIADHYLEDLYCQGTDVVEEVAVKLEPGTDQGVLQAAIEAFHGGPHQITYTTGESQKDLHYSDIQRDFILFDVLLGLTAILAGLGVLNGQLLAALERSKELGVLKALGTSRGQLAGMVLLEGLVVGLVGGGLGAGLGAGLTPMVVGALRQLVGLDLPHVGPGYWLWLGWAGSVVVACLAAIYPIWRTTRADAVRAVRTG